MSFWTFCLFYLLVHVVMAGMAAYGLFFLRALHTLVDWAAQPHPEKQGGDL